MARELYRDVQRYRRSAAAAAAEEIKAEFPRLTIPPVREYPVEAIEKALANAVVPPPPVQASAVPDEMPTVTTPEPTPDAPPAEPGQPEPQRPEPKRDEPKPPQPQAEEPKSEDRPREEPAAPQQPRARVTHSGEKAPADKPRGRARVTVTASELNPQARRQARARVVGPTPKNRTEPVVISQVAARVSATMERHMRQAARDLVVDTAEGAGEEIGWARVLSGKGNTCPFCAMLASRGPVYHSDKSALTVVGQRGRTRGNRELGESYHDHCACRTVLVRKGAAWDGQQEYQHLERLWIAASALADSEEVRLVFNRMFRRIGADPDVEQELEKFWDSATSDVPDAKKARAFAKALQQNPPAALEAARSPRRAAA